MLKNAEKSQIAIEFLILFAAALLFFALFFTVINERISEKNKEKEMILIKNLALTIQDEINLATKATSGYRREFLVTEKISSKDYYINITDDRIYIKTDKNAISYPVEEIEGSIKKGINVIRKENDKTYLN